MAPKKQQEVAVIGMACMFPGAGNLDAYWNNITGKVDAVSDPPPEAWDPEVYYQPDASATDRVYCKRGGFLGGLASFAPLAHGIPPVAVGGEPDQWLALQVAYDALADAGYEHLEEKVRHRTAVILGKGTYVNGGNALVLQHAMIVGQTIDVIRQLHPEFPESELEQLRQEMKAALPPLNPETMPGLIPNIIVGRIANRLDLMGPSYTVDAACASSLVAIEAAMRDLNDGLCDLALVGGSQVWVPVGTVNVFSQLGALSRRQQIRPFDEQADGTLLGEGIGMVVAKRLEDARRDGDRIYAIIRSVGVASDGRGASVMAPRVEGEALALRRAYDAAGVSPRSIGLIEAHGTGTPVGDVVEVQALSQVFGARDGEPWCALGSVKSMIGHTMPAAGIAGLIKTALALYHRVLPPTLNCTKPNPKLGLENTPFYLNTETRPWIHGGVEPRRAAVNAFGFGGINAHLVMEEWPDNRAAERPVLEIGLDHTARPLESHVPEWETEVLILEGESAAELSRRALQLQQFLAGPAAPRLKDLAFSLNSELSKSPGQLHLAVVASSPADLGAKLERAAQRLADPSCRRIKDAAGIYFAAEPLARQGKLAFLFPGEGGQYVNMLADLCLHFPEAREWFDQMDRICYDGPRGYLLSNCVFPRPSFSDAERDRAEKRLGDMDVAVNAVFTADQAILSVLRQLGPRPDVVVGHSTGEYSAIRAAGIIDPDDQEWLAKFGHELKNNHDAVLSGEGVPRALMLAVAADRTKVEDIAREVGGELYVAMDNCPHQTVLVGDRENVERALEVVRREGLVYQRLNIDRAYHTPGFAPFTEHLREIFARIEPMAPRLPIYSSTTAALYPSDPDAVRQLIVNHWVEPVEFRRTVEAMYADGVRIFVEVGPKGNLTSFVEDILRGRPFCAVAADMQRRSGITQLNHLVGTLVTQGVSLDPTYLYSRRDCRHVDWEAAQPDAPAEPPVRVQLSTSFPMLRLPEAVAERFRQRSEAKPANRVAPPSLASPAPELAGPVTHAQAFVPTLPPVLPGPARVSSAGEQPLAAGQAMAGYLRTMQQFLEVQEQVMHAYLGAAVSPPAAGTQPAETPLAAETRPLATSAPRPERDAPAAEDVSRVESGPPRTAEPIAAEAVVVDQQSLVAKQLLAVVSERTGYPEDMLDWQLDLEADLGIDSIKRVEILGSYSQRFGTVQGVELEDLTSLRTIRQIIDALSRGPEAQIVPAPLQQVAVPAYSLLGQIVSSIPEQELVTERTFDLDQDRYLRDHTLGRDVSRTDPDLTALAIMPLTMSLELVSEAAATLLPGKHIVGFRDIRAQRWITCEDKPVRLRVTARRLASQPDRVAVELRNLTEDATSGAPMKSPVLEAVVLLGDAFPPAPEPAAVPSGMQPSIWQVRELYGQGMFHGPSWQGVVGIEGSGAAGSVARLRVLPIDGFLQGQPEPCFAIDPVTLDAAGQVVGFWTMERLDSGKVIFPFHVEAIDLYGPTLSVGAELSCRARIELLGEQLVRSDIDLVTPADKLWCRIGGWKDKRFDLPAEFEPLMLSEPEDTVSQVWAMALTASDSGLVCRRAPATFPSDRTLWKQVWSRRILSRAERTLFGELPEERQLEWLAARAAAKDAVASFAAGGLGVRLLPADIEILPDESGRPGVKVRGLDAPAFAVSLAHTAGWGGAILAVADDARRLPLVGFEFDSLAALAERFDDAALDESEQAVLSRLRADGYEDWSLRACCAKAALVKASGRNLGFARITAVDPISGTVTAILRTSSTETAERAADVRTTIADGLVVAIVAGPNVLQVAMA